MRKKRNAYYITAAAVVMTAVIASAEDNDMKKPKPVVVTPDLRPHGLTYEQWSAKWWQWAWSIPADQNPILEHPYPVDCHVYQDRQAPVLFLVGTNGWSATGAKARDCTVTEDQMLFFPLVNLGNEYPCPDKNFKPGPGQSMEQFLTVGFRPSYGARQYIDHTSALSAKLDGVPLVPTDLTLPPTASPYRATSSMFEMRGHPSLAPVWDACITGREQPAVSDGYWIMLNPLSRGNHTLEFSATQTYAENPPPNTFSVAVTYRLTVR